jgi:hypothetical protein
VPQTANNEEYTQVLLHKRNREAASSPAANVKKKLGQCSKKTRPPALLKNQATWPKIAIKKVDHPGLFRSPGGVWIAMLGSICL